MQGGKTDARLSTASTALESFFCASIAFISQFVCLAFFACFFIKYTVSRYPWLFWNLMCRPGWLGPEFRDLACLYLQSAGMIGVHNHAQPVNQF